jgi:hypothetical protein
MTEIEQKYSDLGGEQGPLGTMNSTGEKNGKDGVGKMLHCRNGSIFWHPDYGAHVVYSRLREPYAKMGYTKEYGYPLEDERPLTDEDRAESNTLKSMKGNLEGSIILLEKSTIVRYKADNGKYVIEILPFKESTVVVYKDYRKYVSEIFSSYESTEVGISGGFDASLVLDINDDPTSNRQIVEYLPKHHPEIEWLDDDKYVVGHLPIFPKRQYGKMQKVTDQSQLRKKIKSLRMPIIQLSTGSKRALVYKMNVEHYSQVIDKKAQLVGKMTKYEINPASLPYLLDYEYITTVEWQSTFHEWFIQNKFEIPIVNLSSTSRRVQWKEGIKAAAVTCIAEQFQNPNISQIKICGKFLKQFEIVDEANYSPEKLSNMVSKLKYEKTDDS